MCNGDNHHCPDWWQHKKRREAIQQYSKEQAARRKAERAGAKAARLAESEARPEFDSTCGGCSAMWSDRRDRKDGASQETVVHHP